MNNRNITFETVFNAIKHQMKFMLLTVLIFALVGAGAGWWYARNTEVPASGHAEALAPVDYSQVPYSYNYYIDSQNYLIASYNNTKIYINFLLENINISEEHRTRLLDCSKRLEEFDGSSITLLQALLRPRDTLFIPPEFMDDAVIRYEGVLRNIELNLIEAENAKELLQSMDAPNVENNDYNSLLSLAAQYGSYQMKKQEYTAILDQLRNNPDQIRTQSRQAERLLQTLAAKLNVLTEELSQIADQIANENAVNLSLTYLDNDSIEIELTHTHTAASSEENFAVLFLFCILVGICCGLFFAICREAKTSSPVSAETSSSKSETDKPGETSEQKT